MPYTLKEIAEALGVEAEGDIGLTVERLSEPSTSTAADLALASNPKYAEALSLGKAQAALLWADADWRALGLRAAIRVGRPRHAMAALTRLYDHSWDKGSGIHETASVHPTAEVTQASVGPFSVIGKGVKIGSGSHIGAHVVIGEGTQIGSKAIIRDGVRIAHGVSIGHGFVAQIGALIGGDGFSFSTPEVSAAETVRETLGEDAGHAQTWERIHSLGGVEIGDDVEIGAGSSIDRGTIRATRIGTGTKIDSLVQVGHNVEVGDHTLLCGQVGIGGSTVIGSHCILGGKTGVVDNVTVGDRVVTGAGTLVMANVPDGRVMLGYPATQMKASLDSYKALRRLPRDIAALKKAVSKLRGSD